MSDHRAPYYSAERTAYYEGLMDQFAEHGGRHLCFTPPTDRGSNITRCEAWALNLQRGFVHSLRDAGRWPVVQVGAHPNTLHDEQRKWLSRFWGDCARKWVEAGCPGATIADLKSRKKEIERKTYSDLVLKTYSDFEHADKREFRDKKSAIERAARQRL